jgi:hypothetical protein
VVSVSLVKMKSLVLINAQPGKPGVTRQQSWHGLAVGFAYYCHRACLRPAWGGGREAQPSCLFFNLGDDYGTA